nr:Protein F36H9.5 [Haemonchus contortus]
MAIFSVVTIRKDSIVLNRYCKIVFCIAASANMLITCAVVIAHRRFNTKRLDVISMAMKIISAIAFCYVAPQYFQRQYANITLRLCHSYLPRVYAVMEYVMIAAYSAFHLSSLIDIRHISFLCYPRTCSGECEPLDPKNFEKGAKFEHCRAFEYQQRQALHYEPAYLS